MCSTVPPHAQRLRDVMDLRPTRLLCVDLQIDPALGLDPDGHAIFSARQLLILGRRLGWSIAHARRRSSSAAAAGEILDPRIAAIRPMMTERVFFRANRSIAESPGLCALLESWRTETVLIAAFDHVALLSSLLACYEHGPRLLLVEDVLSPRTLADTTSMDAFRAAARRLAAGSVGIADIIAHSGSHPAPEPLHVAAGGLRRNATA
jgi:hypothetical protein